MLPQLSVRNQFCEVPVFVSAQTLLGKSSSDRAERLRSQMPKLSDTASTASHTYCLMVYLLWFEFEWMS